MVKEKRKRSTLPDDKRRDHTTLLRLTSEQKVHLQFFAHDHGMRSASQLIIALLDFLQDPKILAEFEQKYPKGTSEQQEALTKSYHKFLSNSVSTDLKKDEKKQAAQLKAQAEAEKALLRKKRSAERKALKVTSIKETSIG